MKLKTMFIIAALFLPGAALVAQNTEGIEFFGNIYTKFLDGNRRVNSGLYNSAEFGNGDVGQGTEFELYFRSKVSRQVEIGGRLKARFDSNFWSNGGGFADDENNPRSAQYMKFRGAYVRVTPGYDWIDSATIGSNDWGQFDPFTIGKIRYIDRDNVSGLLFQGSSKNRAVRWDFARVSLPKLWAGPEFTTGDLHQNDAAYAIQVRGDVSDAFNMTGIVEYIRDSEIDPQDLDNRDGVELTQRYRNTVAGLKFDYTGDKIGLQGAYYYSDFSLGVDINPRFSPTINGDLDESAWKLDFTINELAEDLTIAVQVFDIGAGFQSTMAARRESDVLLTEGHTGTWGWSRPDYNRGSNDDGNARSQIGYGGWTGETHQVVNLAADNDFTDFDEGMAESVLGWKGYTIVPSWSIADIELAAEFTYIDYNSNWQNCGGDCIYPVVDGVHSWGLGGDWRSPYATFSEKETLIWLIKGSYIFDVGSGLELTAKYKATQDEDDRVTDPNLLSTAYTQSSVTSVNYDNRDADYTDIELSLGYQLTPDLYGALYLASYNVDLFDGTIDVTTPNMEAWEPEFGWIEYLTGEHEKDMIGVQLKYFLSGMEFGLNAQWFDGEYEPEFFEGVDGRVVRINPTTDGIQTALGVIDTDEVDFDHYRLKAFLKVQF